MRVAYFGTSDRSIPVLESLNKNFELVLCVTKNDTVVGRKQEKRETEVKKWAKTNKKPLVEISGMKEDKLKIIDSLIVKKVEIGVVADFSFMIPEEIINTPRHKLINVHFSLLPKLRGASPVQFTILQGYEKTGITYYLMTKGMDNGPVLRQVEHELKGNESADKLYKSLFLLAAENLTSVLNDYVNRKITPVEQDESKATYTYSPSHPKNTFIFKEDAEVNWEKEDELIWRCVRAHTPWPIAWSTLEKLEDSRLARDSGLKVKQNKDKNLKIKIYEAELNTYPNEDNDKENKNQKTGSNVHQNKNFRLKITTLQVEGSKKISWEEFKNGYLEHKN